MKIKTSLASGFTLVEIMIVVAIIGLLASIAVPNFIKSRQQAQKIACINNLRQIDGGKQQWALENKKNDTDTPTSDEVKLYLKNNSFPHCPASGTYTELPGWDEDISGARSLEELPQTAREYVEYIEDFLGVPVVLVGVGPGRDQMIWTEAARGLQRTPA